MDRNKPFILCYPNQKRPIGNDWGSRTLSASELTEALAEDPMLNCGVVLGPQTFVDIECDGEAATAHYSELFGDVRTPCWSSKRGRHHLFRYDPRLSDLPGKVMLEPSKLEFRLGNGKQVQSVIPPSIVDGIRREWIVSMDECQPAPLPEHVIGLLLSLPREKIGEHRETSGEQASHELIQRAINYVRQADTRLKDDKKNTAFRLAGNLHAFVDEATGARLTENQIFAIIQPWNMLNDPPLSDDVLREKIHNATTYTPRADKAVEASDRPIPRINIDHELHRMVDDAITALGNAPNTYQYGQALVQVVYDAEKPPQCLHDNGSPQLVVIPSPILATRLSACADWWRFDARAKKDEKKWKRAIPQPAVISAVHVAGKWPSVSPITGIVSCPVLRADGTILAEPGYDRETGLYLDNGESYPALMRPDEAVALLHDVVCDFPFVTPAHRSAWLAFLITLVTRPAFAGNAPFFLFEANAPGTGKGLLTDVTTMIVEGRVACRYSWSSDNEETRKLITTVGMSGAPYLLWDNIKGTLGGAALEQMMTTGIWADRVLGGNRQVQFPIRFIPAGTGNNAKLSHDMLRRTCHCKQHSPLENPAERTGFKHPDLLDYIKNRRPELVMAALSIPAAFINAGRPDQKLPEWGSYDAWSNLVRGSLVYTGLPDPAETREGLRLQADDDTSLLRSLMELWPGKASITKAIEAAIENQPFADVLAELPGRDPGKALRTLLRDARGRNIGGKRFERTDGRPSQWYVCEALGA